MLKFTEEQEEAITRMYSEDTLSIKTISDLFNCSYSVIHKILIKRGVIIRPSGKLLRNGRAYES
jgi:predicted DNA-binding protein YlxM (UPF0122 family)